MSKINVMALGGLDEKNKNMYILEIDSKIYILDSGIYEPLNSNFGIQHLVPDIKYLKKNNDKIKGLFLSNANRQQIASVVNIIKYFPNIKIYGSNVTIGSLEIFFPKINFKNNVVILKNGEKINIGGINVSTIELNSSIPGNFGYVFNTIDGNIFYFTDYIFDWIQEYNVPLLEHIKNYSDKKNLLFLSDSLNMEIESSISPQFRITNLTKNKFILNKRIIAFVYEDELINIIELINLSIKNNKKIFFIDEEIIKLINLISESGYFKKYNLYSMKEYTNENEKNSVIIVTGTKSSLYKLTMKILLENDSNWLNIIENDIVFLISGPQPGNEDVFQTITSKISRIKSDTVIPNFETKFLIHPSQFDLKNYLKLLNPKYFLPIKGYYKELIKAKNLAIEINIPKENVIIGENGEQFTFENENLNEESRKIKEIGIEIIEINSNFSIDSEIIEQRQSLGKDGILTSFFLIDSKTRKINSNIDIQLKGVIYIKNQENLISQLEQEIKNITEENEKETNLNKIISLINKSFVKILKDNIRKIPKIIIKIKVI